MEGESRVLNVMACEGNEHFVPVLPAELPHLLGQEDQLLWIDIQAPSDEEVAVLSSVFQFHSLTIDDCLNHRDDPAKADDYGAYLFVIVQGIAFDSQGDMLGTNELDIYLGKNYVVSFHHKPIAAIHELRERLLRAAPLPSRGADWLAHAMIDMLVDQLLPVVEAMDDELSDLEDQALADPDPALIYKMTSIKRQTIQLRRLVSPQRDLINRFSRGDFPHLVSEPVHIYYRDIYDHLVRLEEMIEGLRDLGDSVISTYLAMTSNRMNEIMKTLSIVGVIFLPLTLLASIFGTNFNDTFFETGWWGFGVMTAVMVISIVGLLWWFKRRGWMD